MATAIQAAEAATVTIEEAAAILEIGRTLAYELARTGRLPALRLGRRLVVTRRGLDALLATGADDSRP